MERRALYVRTGAMAALTVAVALVFLGLLWYHQLYIGMDEATLAALTTTTRTETIPAARGGITDRNGVVLVDSQTQYRITLDVTQMGDRAAQGNTVLRLLELCQHWGEEWTDRELPISETAPYTYTETSTRLGQLCQVMGWEQSTDGAELLNQMKETFALNDGEELTRAALGVLYSCYLREKELLWTEYTFADNVGIGLITALGEEQLPGVDITPVSVRRLQTTYAPHLLGRVGQSGVECAFDTYLLGQEGKRTVTTDRSGNILSEEETTSPCKGADVTLTLDAKLQRVAEDALAQYVPQLNGGTGGGAAVVVNVADGGILACASYPTYDLQTMTYAPSAEGLSPFFNRALQGVYSPGSTFKMVTAVAGLETGVIQTDSAIPCTGYLDYYGTVFRCWLYRERGETHSAGETVSQALQDSCNIFFYQLGIALGIDTLTDYAQAFGLGEPTGIELGEATGVNAGPDYSESVGATWYPGNLLSAAIGQSDNLFTPLQIASYIATLVNGGTRYAAHLLQCVTYADGTVEEYQPQVLGRVELSEATLTAVKAGMRGVVTNTAAVSRAFSDLEENGIAVGAKTGSAQVTGQVNANGLFVCFAPYDAPEVAVCVAVEQGGSGAATAVIAAQILEAYFNIQEETAPAPAG